jgi:hypothetical protein
MRLPTCLVPIVLGTTLATGCVTVQGGMSASGGSLDGWNFAPDTCRNGQRGGFFGFDLYRRPDDSDYIRHNGNYVRVIHDEMQGTVLRIYEALREGDSGIPGMVNTATAERVLEIRSSECPALRSIVQSPLYQKYPVVTGRVDVDCVATDGTRVTGAVVVQNCS